MLERGSSALLSDSLTRMFSTGVSARYILTHIFISATFLPGNGFCIFYSIRLIGKTAENAYFFYLDPGNGIFDLNLIHIPQEKVVKKTLE